MSPQGLRGRSTVALASIRDSITHAVHGLWGVLVPRAPVLYLVLAARRGPCDAEVRKGDLALQLAGPQEARDWRGIFSRVARVRNRE